MVQVATRSGLIRSRREGLAVPARSRLSPRRLQVALGLIWLLDGALQFQPYMYKPGADGFLGPVSQNAMGPPNVLTDFISSSVTFMVGHQVLATTFIGVVQAAIGAGLCWRRSVRAALAASVAWALGVWVIGEAAGQLIYPETSMLTGAPGAALVYALLALVLWPHNERAGAGANPHHSVADEGLLGGPASRGAWAVLWCGSALLELERANHAPNAISAQLANAVGGEPAPLAWLGQGAAGLTHGIGTEVALVLLLVEFVVGWTVLRAPTRRFGLALGIVASLVFWVFGQDLGTIFTGHGTDPNLGPPMVLLALALWSGAFVGGSGGTLPDRAVVGGSGGTLPDRAVVGGETGQIPQE